MVFLVFTECLRGYPISLLKQLIEIGNGRKANIVADGKNGIIRILQLEGCLLKPDLIQVFRHGIAGVLPETAAKIGFVEVERL